MKTYMMTVDRLDTRRYYVCQARTIVDAINDLMFEHHISTDEILSVSEIRP